MPRIETEEQI